MSIRRGTADGSRSPAPAISRSPGSAKRWRRPDAPRDPRFATPTARLANRAAADALVADWIAKHDLAEVEARFAAVGVTGTAVRSVDEIIVDEHVKAREDLLPLRSQSGRDFLAPAHGAEALAHSAPRARRALRGSASTRTPFARRSTRSPRARSQGVDRRRRSARGVRSREFACSTSRSGSPARRRRRSSATSAPT